MSPLYLILKNVLKGTVINYGKLNFKYKVKTRDVLVCVKKPEMFKILLLKNKNKVDKQHIVKNTLNVREIQ